MGIPKQVKQRQKQEITGVIFLTLAVLCLISLVTPEAGRVSRLVEHLLRSATGEGRYLFPLFLTYVGIRMITLEGQVRRAQRFLGGIILFVVALALLHLFIPRPYALRAGLKGEGGGLFGAVCGYLLEYSFGLTGMYVVLVTLVLIGILLSTGLSLSALGGTILKKLKESWGRWKKFCSSFLFSEEDAEEPPVQPIIIDRSGSEMVDSEGNPAVNPVEKEEIFTGPKFEHGHVMVVRPLKKQNYLSTEPGLFAGEAECSATAEFPGFQLPPIGILAKPGRPRAVRANKDITENIRILEETLQNFGVKAKVTQVSRGPTITRYEIQPPPGVKVSRIVGLADDIALCMAAPDVRIEAPIPGKAAVGIEVPNREISTVHLRELLETGEFQSATSRLTVALGKDIAGNPVVTDLAQMPHLLIAGATGSGKSVCLNTLIASILFKATPDEVKFLIIDPKMVELSNYNGIPHLVSPVVTDPKKAATSLRWAVKEMEYRYELFAAEGVRDISRYNALRRQAGAAKAPLPLLVIIIDELSDLMMVAPADVEDAVCRLAQMARAAGIHLVVATQRPSVDVITGLIKANIPSRISFAVSSQIDSRTILDMAGAEKLLGRGDMLFYPVGAPKPLRLQGAYLSDREVEALVSFLKKQACPSYEQRFLGEAKKEAGSPELEDELLPRAVEIFIETGHASVSLLQRRLRIGYARAARLVDIMEKKGIVGAYEGSKPRAVLMTLDQYQQTFKK
ncbi:MAG: DNA translocase FtsK [Bacillota bacterium]